MWYEAAMPLNPLEKARREGILRALHRAEQDYQVAEIIEAVGISNQMYAQFKDRLYLGRTHVARLERWLVDKHYLETPSAYDVPFPTDRTDALSEIEDVLGAMRSMSAEARRDGCTAAIYGFLESGARHIAEVLVPRGLTELQDAEEGSNDKTV